MIKRELNRSFSVNNKYTVTPKVAGLSISNRANPPTVRSNSALTILLLAGRRILYGRNVNFIGSLHEI